MQYDQRLHCPLTEPLGTTTECMNGEQRPKLYFAHVQDDLNLHISCMFKDTFFPWCGSFILVAVVVVVVVVFL